MVTLKLKRLLHAVRLQQLMMMASRHHYGLYGLGFEVLQACY